MYDHKLDVLLDKENLK